MYGSLRRTRDQAHANFSRNEAKRAKMRAAFAEIGATTLEQMNAVTPEIVAHIMSEAGYTADDLLSDGVAFEETRERDAEAAVKALNARGAQHSGMVGALSAGLKESITNKAAVRSALDGVDPNYALFSEEQRILEQIGSNEKPKALDALQAKDEKVWQPIFDAALEQPKPINPHAGKSTEELVSEMAEATGTKQVEGARATGVMAVPLVSADDVAVMQRQLERLDNPEPAKSNSSGLVSKRFDGGPVR